MAKWTEKPEATEAASGDLLLIVSDPDGTPASKKIRNANLVGFEHSRYTVVSPNSSVLDSFAMSSTTAGTNAASLDDDDNWMQYTSAATLNSVAGVRNTQIITRRAHSPTWFAKIKTGASVSAVRIFVGVTTGPPTTSPLTSDAETIHYAGFRYSTATDGTAFWRTVTDDGSGTPTVTETSVAVAVNTPYRLMIVLGASDVKFFIDGALVATHTAKLPGASQNLFAYVQAMTLEAAAKVLKFNRYMVRSR